VKSKQLGGILLFVLLAVIAIVAITVHYRTPSEENQVVPPPFNLLENATFRSIPDVIENSSDYWGEAVTVEGYYTLLYPAQFVGGNSPTDFELDQYIPSIGILTESPMSFEQQTNIRENKELPEIALLTVGGGSENILVPYLDNTSGIELISGGKYRVTGILRVDTEIYLPFFSVYLEVRQFSEVN